MMGMLEVAELLVETGAGAVVASLKEELALLYAFVAKLCWSKRRGSICPALLENAERGKLLFRDVFVGMDDVVETVRTI